MPEDSSLTRGRLDNGVAYWIHPLHAPAGSVSIWLRVGSGSLNEARDQRGIAHFVEHLAFSGTKNFPRGEAIGYFESLGLRFGQDENGSTDFLELARVTAAEVRAVLARYVSNHRRFTALALPRPSLVATGVAGRVATRRTPR